jgi:hypothetical protein
MVTKILGKIKKSIFNINFSCEGEGGRGCYQSLVNMTKIIKIGLEKETNKVFQDEICREIGN